MMTMMMPNMMENDDYNYNAVDYGIQTETVANEFEFLRNYMSLNDQDHKSHHHYTTTQRPTKPTKST